MVTAVCTLEATASTRDAMRSQFTPSFFLRMAFSAYTRAHSTFFCCKAFFTLACSAFESFSAFLASFSSCFAVNFNWNRVSSMVGPAAAALAEAMGRDFQGSSNGQAATSGLFPTSGGRLLSREDGGRSRERRRCRGDRAAWLGRGVCESLARRARRSAGVRAVPAGSRAHLWGFAEANTNFGKVKRRRPAAS